MIGNVIEIEELFDQKLYTLTRNTSAIQAISDLDGNTRLGMILQLPEGAEVRTCGEGFNERTIKVCWEGGFYYVFVDDIEPEPDRAIRIHEHTQSAAWARAMTGGK
jgi:hypothetical protein